MKRDGILSKGDAHVRACCCTRQLTWLNFLKPYSMLILKNAQDVDDLHFWEREGCPSLLCMVMCSV